MRFIYKIVVLLSILPIIIVCADESGEKVNEKNKETPSSSIQIKKAYPGLKFKRPVDFQEPNDNTNRIFVVEQRGIISSFSNNETTTKKIIFLDIENKVVDFRNEMGLLGLAFHPNYKDNGLFYVNYTTANTTRISRFQVTANDSNKANPSSETILMEFSQPYRNHNGGQLAFGPDGYLYIAVGDGGSAGDPKGHAQNRENLLGNILRIDINKVENGLNYGIPDDNPYVDDTNFRKEIYAYGLRNPWRISFDVETGALWAGDVGQNKIEEIDVIEKGKNYGWNIMEASDCFKADSCNKTDLIPPVFEYAQTNGDVSITGGYVYRGNAIASLKGKYIYGDFVSGRIWALSTDLNTKLSNELVIDTDITIASFGTDASNEIYFCSFDGYIYKFQEN